MAETPHACCNPPPGPSWTGKSTGKIIIIDGIETYIAKTRESNQGQISKKEPQRVILHLTEGHSIYFGNAQLLADAFSTNLGCDVIMPDQFAGEERVPRGHEPSFPEGKPAVPSARGNGDVAAPHYRSKRTPEEFEAWKKRFEPPTTDSVLARIIHYIHTTYGPDVNIGGVGYCFGGRYVMRLMGSGIIDVGVVNHPSFFTMKEVGKLGVGKRLAMFAAERDEILPAEKRRATEDVLTREQATWMSTVFSGTEHGFTVRGNLEVKEVRMAKEKAFKGAVEWFEEWL